MKNNEGERQHGDIDVEMEDPDVDNEVVTEGRELCSTVNSLKLNTRPIMISMKFTF